MKKSIVGELGWEITGQKLINIKCVDELMLHVPTSQERPFFAECD